MSTAFTPRLLVDGLRQRCPRARNELELQMSAPLERLCRAHAARHPDLLVDETLISRLLHWLDAWLRNLPQVNINRWDNSPAPWRLFCIENLSSVSRLMLWEPGGFEPFAAWEEVSCPPEMQTGVFRGDEHAFRQTRELPTWVHDHAETLGYGLQLYFRPRDRVGGDWILLGFGRTSDLHALVADFCGKSWTGFVLKQCVHLAWKSTLPRSDHPKALLQKLHERLRNQLPEGTFVEVVAAHFHADGTSQFASAGMGNVLLLPAATGAVAREKLSALPMGIDEITDLESQTWVANLMSADEVSLSSDGLYDQPTELGRIGESLVTTLNTFAPVANLHSALVSLVNTALESEKQHDDLTILSIKRTARCGENGGTPAIDTALTGVAVP